MSPACLPAYPPACLHACLPGQCYAPTLPAYYESYDTEEGVKCYFTGCHYIGTKWQNVLEHVRSKHKVRTQEHSSSKAWHSIARLA